MNRADRYFIKPIAYPASVMDALRRQIATNFGDPNVSPSRALADPSAMSDPNVSLNHHGTRTYPVEEQ